MMATRSCLRLLVISPGRVRDKKQGWGKAAPAAQPVQELKRVGTVVASMTIAVAVERSSSGKSEFERGQDRRVGNEEMYFWRWQHVLSSLRSFSQAACFQFGWSSACGGQSAILPTGRPAISLAKPWLTSRWCASSARTTRTTSRRVAVFGRPQ